LVEQLELQSPALSFDLDPAALRQRWDSCSPPLARILAGHDGHALLVVVATDADAGGGGAAAAAAAVCAAVTAAITAAKHLILRPALLPLTLCRWALMPSLRRPTLAAPVPTSQ